MTRRDRRRRNDSRTQRCPSVERDWYQFTTKALSPQQISLTSLGPVRAPVYDNVGGKLVFPVEVGLDDCLGAISISLLGIKSRARVMRHLLSSHLVRAYQVAKCE